MLGNFQQFLLFLADSGNFQLFTSSSAPIDTPDLTDPVNSAKEFSRLVLFSHRPRGRLRNDKF